MKRFLPYRAVVSARYRMLLQYRAAAFAGLVTQCFWGAIRLMILAAFYAASTQAQPMSLPEVVAYIWLGQAFFGMLPWNIDEEFAQKVRDGSVAYDLLRPVDLYAFWYSHTLAYRTAPTTLRAIPLGLLAILVLPRLGLAEWALEGTAILGVGCALWRVSRGGRGVVYRHHDAVAHLLAVDHLRRRHRPDHAGGGHRVCRDGDPVTVVPRLVQPFLHWQPFRGLVDVPFRIYSGNIPPP